jgi:hypothetical protein
MQGEISYQNGLLLSDLLQMLCQSKRKGCLELEDPISGEKAFINLKEESILNASSGSDKDIDAIAKFMAKKRLNFKLLNEVRDPTERIKGSVTNILLQCSVAIDTGTTEINPLKSANTFFTVFKGASVAVGGASEQENQDLKQDADYIQYQASRIGDALHMSVFTAAALSGPQDKMALRYVSSELHGMRSQQPINITRLLELI